MDDPVEVGRHRQIPQGPVTALFDIERVAARFVVSFGPRVRAPQAQRVGGAVVCAPDAYTR